MTSVLNPALNKQAAHLVKAIKTFFAPLRPLKKPLLVGYSGGEDSTALVLALQECSIPHELAHFDHGWREESKKQAAKLRDAASVPFHTHRSENPQMSEDAARKERFQFFESLFANGRFSALVLAHHRHDLAETVLKRVLEGSHLRNLKGILPVSRRGEMPIWRPLLEVSKQEIRAYLNGQSFIDDSSNRDERYLRGRMRQTIFPLLNREFGKEITPALSLLAEYGMELDDYVKTLLPRFSPVEGPFGKMWDFTSAHPFEMREVIHATFPMSHAVCSALIQALQEKMPNRKMCFGNQTLHIDRGCLFSLKKTPPLLQEPLPLREGDFERGGWIWSIRHGDGGQVGWKAWWKGSIAIELPEGSYFLTPANGEFKKEWNHQKIPAILRPFLPILVQNGEAVGHFFRPLGKWKNFSKSMSVNIEIKEKV